MNFDAEERSALWLLAWSLRGAVVPVMCSAARPWLRAMRETEIVGP